MTNTTRLSDPVQEKLAVFLVRQYPELDEQKILELGELGEGWETDLLRLKIEGTRNGEPSPLELVLRLYKGSDPLEKARKEFSLMSGVPGFGVATPRVDALVTDLSIFNDPFLIMEHIEGGTLEARIEIDGISQWLDPMMQILARIHNIPWVGLFPVPEGPLPGLEEPLAFVRGHLHEMDQVILQYGLTDFEPTLEWLHEREALGASTTPVLVHNDYHPQNMLLSNGELLIIDWSFAEVSDYRLDLAWSVLLLNVLVGQSHRPAILEAYERAAGSQIENFEYFEALKFMMRMVTIGTWLDEAVGIPVAGITKQSIRGDYKVHVLNPYRRLKEITGLEIRTIEEL